MKGILLISHGKMAEGVFDSLKTFFSEDIPQIDFLGLTLNDSPEAFREEVEKKIAQLDTGDGVLIFADIQGGTPANVASTLILSGRDVTVFSGMNLPMVIETMFLRSGDNYTVDAVLEAGRKSVVCINDLLKKHGNR